MSAVSQDAAFAADGDTLAAKGTRTQRRGLLLLSVLLVALWVPGLTAPGESGFNFSIVLALAILLHLLTLGRAFNPVMASRADAHGLGLIALCILGLTVSSLVSASYAPVPFRVFRVAAAQGFGIVILYAIVHLKPAGRAITRLVNLFVWGAVLSALYALLSHFIPGIPGGAFGYGDRAAGFFRHPNQFGIALAMAVPVLVALCLGDRRRVHRVAQLAMVFMGLILSGSKTNIVLSLGAAGVVLVAGLWVGGTLRRAPLRALLVCAGAVGASLVLHAALGAFNPRAQALLSTLMGGDEIGSLASRLAIWEHSLAVGAAHPLGGVGAGQYVFGDAVSHSHNVFLDMFRTLGVPGLVLVTVLIGAVFVLGVRRLAGAVAGRRGTASERVLAVGLAVSALGYLVSNQVSESFGPSTLPLFWVVLGLALLLPKAGGGVGDPVAAVERGVRLSGFRQ